MILCRDLDHIELFAHPYQCNDEMLTQFTRITLFHCNGLQLCDCEGPQLKLNTSKNWTRAFNFALKILAM